MKLQQSHPSFVISVLFQVRFKNTFPFAAKQAKFFLYSQDSHYLVMTQNDLVEDFYDNELNYSLFA